MVIDTSKEKLNINKVVCEKEEKLFITEDIIVPDSKPDILSTINTSGNICVYKKEIIDDKVKIDGDINAYIMYMTDNSGDIVRGINVSLNFSKIIDAPNCKDDMILDMNTEIMNIECNVINGRKINVKAEIKIKFKVYTNENIELVNGILNNNDIQVLKKSMQVNSLTGYGKTKAYVKENIMLDNTDNLAEILKVNINMIDKDVKISYNKVLAKADAEVKIMYLTEENKVVSSSNKIPVVGFVDIQDVSEDNVCDTVFEIRNMIIKPNSIEEHSIYVELEIEVYCMSYEQKELELLEDLYSPLENLDCNKKEITVISNKENRIETFNLNEIVNLQDIVNDSIIDVDCNPKITNINILNSKINYEGDVELSFTISESNNQINIVKSTIPFNYTIDDIENGELLDITTDIEIGETDYTIKTGGDVLANIKLIFNIGMSKNEQLKVIDNIKSEENEKIQDYSLIIYIVKSGDTLWSIAKNLKSTIEDIVKANALEDENKIKIGDKLYIPRYVKYA